MHTRHLKASLLLALFALGSMVNAAEVTELREDFSEPNAGDWGLFFQPIARLADGETVRTPLQDAVNDSMGPWGGYYPIGGASQGGLFISGAALPNVIINEGSLFGVDDADSVGNGFVVFGAYPTPPDTTLFDESGGYLYTAFPSKPIDLSGNALIQFDGFNGTQQESASIEMRVMLRVATGASPEWILSHTFPLTSVPKVSTGTPPVSGSAFTDGPAVSLEPESMTWVRITAPTDANLVSLQSGDDTPLTLGAAVPAPDLTEVTGFGLLLATDIVRNDVYGVGVDAIRLLTARSPVARWDLYR